MEFVTVLGTIAAVVAAILAIPQTQMPQAVNIRWKKGHDQKRKACMNLSFVFATSFLGLKLCSVTVPGYKIRSRDWVCVEEEMASESEEIDFVAVSGSCSRECAFVCFASESAPLKPVMILRFRWRCFSWSRKYRLT